MRKNTGVDKTLKLKPEAQTVKTLHVVHTFVKDSKSNFDEQFHLTFFSQKIVISSFATFPSIDFTKKFIKSR